MDIQEIRQLVKLVEKSSIDELEIVEENLKIRISKHAPADIINNAATNPVYLQPQQAAPATGPVAAVPAAETVDADKYYEVRSPMVGTFYRSPAPDAESYVKEGDKVSVGSTLCIIEAMKLLNELQSDYSGRVAKILVENAQPVEYNQVLFLIEK